MIDDKFLNYKNMQFFYAEMVDFQKCMISQRFRVHIQIRQFIPHTYPPPSSLQSLFHGMHILQVQQSFYEQSFYESNNLAECGPPTRCESNWPISKFVYYIFQILFHIHKSNVFHITSELCGESKDQVALLW